MTKFENELKDVMTGLLSRHRQEIIDTPEGDLNDFWYFAYKDDQSIEWNIYQFSQCLEAYNNSCRTWEEHHNGYSCVVERVRDKYLWPKIKEFKQKLYGKMIEEITS